ncbi:hypothetical protein A8C56_13765 [Niabella ginsenosidivorans]|uniref:Uncharacterized protein n=1 Tax=Niabella ginsenosidivorans TaxID=1176587 RepID=A0A1A9I4C3_9BACT|nr:hypothetical protein [Niabella ginsenosidivorans]ANH81899.1 hypothetical protein A8C56_13765 [Niabella ginsenosidivorans]
MGKILPFYTAKPGSDMLNQQGNTGINGNRTSRVSGNVKMETGISGSKIARKITGWYRLLLRKRQNRGAGAG